MVTQQELTLRLWSSLVQVGSSLGRHRLGLWSRKWRLISHCRSFRHICTRWHALLERMSYEWTKEKAWGHLSHWCCETEKMHSWTSTWTNDSYAKPKLKSQAVTLKAMQVNVHYLQQRKQSHHSPWMILVADLAETLPSVTIYFDLRHTSPNEQAVTEFRLALSFFLVFTTILFRVFLFPDFNWLTLKESVWKCFVGFQMTGHGLPWRAISEIHSRKPFSKSQSIEILPPIM